MAGDAGDLAEAIEALRADLESAIEEGQGKNVQFGVGEIELTLQLVATKHGGGKIGWSVLGLAAGAENARTHTIKLKLTPRRVQADGTYDNLVASTGPISFHLDIAQQESVASLADSSNSSPRGGRTPSGVGRGETQQPARRMPLLDFPYIQSRELSRTDPGDSSPPIPASRWSPPRSRFRLRQSRLVSRRPRSGHRAPACTNGPGIRRPCSRPPCAPCRVRCPRRCIA